jgi:PKHD-type hydroxylase
MILQYYYCHFTKILSPEFCSKVVEHGLQQEQTEATVASNAVSKRNSSIVWLYDEWIRDEIYPYIHKANKEAGWNFDWDDSEPIQFTKYKKGQFYDWHRDQLPEPHGYNDEVPTGWRGKIRKLSVTINLLDEKEYTGGDFEFDFRKKYEPYQPEKCKEIAPIGSIVVFPSFVWHRITPVISGTRYSLVMWTLGRPFK